QSIAAVLFRASRRRCFRRALRSSLSSASSLAIRSSRRFGLRLPRQRACSSALVMGRSPSGGLPIVIAHKNIYISCGDETSLSRCRNMLDRSAARWPHVRFRQTLDSMKVDKVEPAGCRKPAVGYCRVSTHRQGRSGLGLEAQRQAIEAFAASNGYELAGFEIEIETGKGADALDRRPKLARALEQA